MKQRNTLDILKKYYLDKKHNVIIISIMFCFNVICLMKSIPIVQTILTDFGIVATSSGITVISVLAWLKNKKQDKRGLNYEVNERDKKEPFPVLRSTYLKELRRVKGCLFVLGESGAGKSRLLCQLEKQLKESSINYVSIKNNYFESWPLMDDAEYIIFDQFEKILDISVPSKRIKSIEALDDGSRTIILSLRKEYFAEINKMFKQSRDYLWVEYNDHEKAQIIKCLYNLIGEENIFDTLDDTFRDDKQRIDMLYLNIINKKIQIELTLLKQIIMDVIENRILFIQLTYLGRILQQDNDGLQQAEDDWKGCRDYNILITHYIEKEIDNFEYSDVAYLILFLLCQDSKGTYANMEEDFANISIQSEEIIRSTLKYLEGLQLILPIKSDNNRRGGAYIAQYEMSHSYVLDILLTLCNSKLDISIRNNIMYCNRECQIKRNEYSAQKEFHKGGIRKKRKNYLNKKNFYFCHWASCSY